MRASLLLVFVAFALPAAAQTTGPCETTEWSVFGACSKSCQDEDGAGIRQRTRMYLSDVAERSNCSEELSEEETCNGDVPCTCTLGDWGVWDTCSQTCDAGVQSREKVVESAADAMCDLDKMGGRQRRACNEQPCVALPEVSAPAEGLPFARLAGDVHVRAITTSATQIFTGNSELTVLTAHDMAVETTVDVSTYGYESITALENDADYVYAAVAAADTTGFAVLKLSKENLAETTDPMFVFSDAGYGDVITMVEDGAHLYVSLSSENACRIIQISKATMQAVGDGSIADAAQVNVIELYNGNLYFGAWDGKIGRIATASVNDLSASNFFCSSPDNQPVVQLAITTHGLFASTDPQEEGVKPVVFWITNGQMENAITEHGSTATVAAQLWEKEERLQGKCTAMEADSERIYCGTDDGYVLTFEQAGFPGTQAGEINIGALDQMGATPAFFGAATDYTHPEMYFVSYSGSLADDQASTLYRFEGFLTPKACETGNWTGWGECVTSRTKVPLQCGEGAQYRSRAVTQEAQWGGTACPAIEQVRPCEKQQEVCAADGGACLNQTVLCCHDGMVRSATKYHVDCNAVGGRGDNETMTTVDGQLDEQCRCPYDRPVEMGFNTDHSNRCGPIEFQCETQWGAKVCEHISCAFVPDGTSGANRIVVRHDNAKHEFDWGTNATFNHKCTHAMGRMGGCTCLCWKDPHAAAIV